MPIIFSTILGWLSSLAGRYLLDVGLKFLAYKVLVYTLLTVTFPIIIKNLIVWLVEQVNSIIQSSLPSGDITSFSASLTGLAGWLGEQLMLPTCISIVLSAIAIRFVLNFIPFIG